MQKGPKKSNAQLLKGAMQSPSVMASHICKLSVPLFGKYGNAIVNGAIL